MKTAPSPGERPAITAPTSTCRRAEPPQIVSTVGRWCESAGRSCDLRGRQGGENARLAAVVSVRRLADGAQAHRAIFTNCVIRIPIRLVKIGSGWPGDGLISRCGWRQWTPAGSQQLAAALQSHRLD